MSEKFNNAHLVHLLVGGDAPKAQTMHLGIAGGNGRRSRHADGGNTVEQRKRGGTTRRHREEGGETREKHGLGGMVLGNVASPFLKKIPHVGGILSGLSSALGGLLPFAEGGDVQAHRKGGRTRRAEGGQSESHRRGGATRCRHEDGGEATAHRKGGRAKRGMGGTILGALAHLLPFAEGGDVQAHRKGGRTHRRSKAYLGGVQQTMPGQDIAMENPMVKRMGLPSPGMTRETLRRMQMLKLAPTAAQAEMSALAKGGHARKKRAMGGVGKVRKDQY